MEGTGGVVERVTATARRLVAGRRVVLVGIPVAGATPLVGQLRDLGAERVLVIGPSVGTGDLPDPEVAEWISLGIEAADVISEFRGLERAVADLSPGVGAALDRFDPDHGALVLVAAFHAVAAVGGRAAYGARRPQWVALEDKTTNDGLFDRAGVRRPPNEVVAVDTRALASAAARLDRGAGSVWAGDARQGFNGGGVFVRWVRDGDDAREATAFFAARCDRVRVAPFLDGIPASIHGMVLGGEVAVFRPVEMVTLRGAERPWLRYAGAATYHDPPEADRREMRAAARAVGTQLRDEVGFRGAFGIDGVLTAEGFLPTEVNPRFGAGMGVLARGLPELPLSLLQWIAAAGDEVAVRAAELEEAVVEAADRVRAGGGWLAVPTAYPQTQQHAVVVESGDGSLRCRAAADGEDADGTVLAGPSSSGGFVRFTADPQRTPVGPSIAPRVCAALAWVDEALSAGIGPVRPAVAVRHRRVRGDA